MPAPDPHTTPPVANEDEVVQGIHQFEHRVVACSYLAAKIVSVLAVLGVLLVLEASVLAHLWSAEFPPNGPGPSQSPASSVR